MREGEKMKQEWWKDAVVYQIYPRSFQDSNGDGIGDINGIRMHLDYLKNLGVDVIWLCPVYKSPNADNGYDISDYQDIHPDFGTMEDFDRLLQEVHEHGMKLIMDLVVNHTSDEHPWFRKSSSAEATSYDDYYIWKDRPNNWKSRFQGSAWTYDEKRGQYYLHIYTVKQPDLNWENEAVRRDVYKMMNWWGKKGIDGFRMDVISMISKDQSYADGPVGEHEQFGDGSSMYINGPRVHEFLQEMNREVIQNFDWMTVGEGVGVDTREACLYAGFDRKELNMMFQFEHVEQAKGPLGKWTDRKPDFLRVKEILDRWQTDLEGKAWNSLFVENHDYARSVSTFADDREEYRELSAKMLSIALYMMKGTPYIYQGQELGMTNYHAFSIDELQDVESKNAYQFYVNAGEVSPEEMLKYVNCAGRDNSRTPMQWNTEENAGFTHGTPWFPVNPNYTYLNAEEQTGRTDSVFTFYQQLLAFRKSAPAILWGSYRMIGKEHKQLLAYFRTMGEETYLILCNFSEKEQSTDTLKLRQQTEAQGKAYWKQVLGNYPSGHSVDMLRPYEGVIWKMEKES